MGRKRNSPSTAYAACLVLAKAPISPGGAGQPAAANVTTWCCWHMSGRPLPLSNSTYGSPRMTRELRDSGLTVGRRRIARLMRDNGLRARQKRRFKRTTDSHHVWPVAPNLLDQDFAVSGPDKKWGADISYVRTREGWWYLAIVIDLFACRIVGWATGDRLHRDLALAALRKALTMRRPAAGLIHHSDRGSQYCSILISMSGKGNCYGGPSHSGA